VIRVLAGYLLVLLAGHAVLRLGSGRWPHRAYGVLGALGLCWLAGVAVLGVVTTLVAVLGGPTRPLPLVAPVLGLLAVTGLLPIHRDARRSGRVDPPVDPPTPRAARLGELAGGLVAATVVARTATLAAGRPVASNDEYALWMVRARALSQLGTLDPRVFTDTGAFYQHQNYPLFFPSLAAWGDGWAGRPSDAAAHLGIAAVLGALVATTGWAVSRLAGPLPALASVVLVASVPTVLSQQSLQLMADVPVFAFGLGLALSLLLWLADRERQDRERAVLVVVAMLAAGACGTKVEGALFTGSALLAALLLARGRRRGLVIAGAVAVLANLPWLAYAQVHHLGNGIFTADTLTVEHLRGAAPFTGHVLGEMADRWPGAGGVLGVLLTVAVAPAAVLAIRNGGGRAVAFLAVVVALDVLVLVVQYVVGATGPATDPVARQLMDGLLRVTVYRVTLVPASLLMIAVPLLAGLGGSSWGRRSRSTPYPLGFGGPEETLEGFDGWLGADHPDQSRLVDEGSEDDDRVNARNRTEGAR